MEHGDLRVLFSVLVGTLCCVLGQEKLAALREETLGKQEGRKVGPRDTAPVYSSSEGLHREGREGIGLGVRMVTPQGRARG